MFRVAKILEHPYHKKYNEIEAPIYKLDSASALM